MSKFRYRNSIGRPCIGQVTKVSQVTAGKRMFVELGDGRSAWARRWSDLILAHANDLGGLDMLSEAQISICKRAATLECELESMEGRKSAGLPVDIEVYGRLTGRLCRMLELVGIRRVTKPVDALADLAKGFAAIDDGGDGDENEELPIERGLDREPGEA